VEKKRAKGISSASKRKNQQQGEGHVLGIENDAAKCGGNSGGEKLSSYNLKPQGRNVQSIRFL
jgi:hypothetical protein